MRKVILVRYGEIILKGLNRPVFEDKLMGNIKKALYGLGKVDIFKSQARIYIEPQSEDYDYDEALQRLVKVFGIVSVSPAYKIESDFDKIKACSLEVAARHIETGKGPSSFKVETKRGNKRFPMDSPEISAALGELLLDSFPALRVDVHDPDFVLHVEVRENSYVYTDILKSNGGLPLGTNGKALLLLSGGIDSPVAGWMMAKRGVEIEAVHFYSYPYTSERAREKVVELAGILARYCYRIRLHIVPFTEIQLEINDKCPQELLTVIMRRAMMSISEKIAQKTGAMALVTGESMGQVASQTIQALYVTNAAVKMPVFRPLIGMDKNEAIEIARKIGTFDTSIQPYEDCCTVFVAKHPKTRPKLEEVERHEACLNLEEFVKKALESTEVIVTGI